MKKIYFIVFITLISLIPIDSYAIEFIDIKNHWAENDIKESILNDIVNGYEDNTFKPNDNITLAEYLKIIIKSANFDLIKEGNYWPDYFIKTAIKKGLILENEFNDYNKNLTRNEIARITARYINVKDIKSIKTNFKDINSEYKEDIQKLVKVNVIKGYEDNTFRGEKEVTRAEAVVIAKRATIERRKLIVARKYNNEEKMNLSNIKKEDIEESSYEIKNNKLYIYDFGRYSNLKGYIINEENINIKNVIKTINILIDEDSYTEVLYVPFPEIVNQLIVRRGENKSITKIGGYDFEITYFENKPYELKRISKQDIFNNECYMKIEIAKLWRDSTKLSNREYVDEYKKEKLRKSLEIEFGIRHADEILDYMLEKYEQKISRETAGIEETEVKNFGNFIINYYKKSDGNPVFYISKNK